MYRILSTKEFDITPGVRQSSSHQKVVFPHFLLDSDSAESIEENLPPKQEAWALEEENLWPVNYTPDMVKLRGYQCSAAV